MHRLKTYGLIILITLIWGTTWLVIKVGLDGISPLFGAGLRFLLAGSVLLGLAKIRGEQTPRSMRQIRHVLIFGVFMFSLPYGLVYWGEQHIPSNLASILFSAMPFWVILYAHLMVPDERFRWEQAVGSAIGFTGVLIIFSEGEFNLTSMFTLGMLAVFGSSACAGFASAWGKRFSDEINHFQTTAYGMLTGSLLLLLFSRFEPNRFFQADWLTIGSIVYLGIFGSAVTFSVYFWLMKHVKVVKLSFITYLSPIVAIIAGWLILNETLSLRIFIGAAIVFVGIFTADIKKYVRWLGRMHA